MNQTVTTVLASVLAGFAGGIAGGIAAATIQRRSRSEGPEAQLIPVEEVGHYYATAGIDFMLAHSITPVCWVDDPCMFHLFAGATEVREIAGGGYRMQFPPGDAGGVRVAWFRVTSLVAPRQVGRLFEVKGIDAVRAVRAPLQVLQEHGEAKLIVVRMVGITIKDYFERQVDALSGGRDASR